MEINLGFHALKRGLNMFVGTVKLYNNLWGFGFIIKADGGQIFFHGSGVKFDWVSEDDRVEFDIDDSSRGPRAVNIRKVI